MENCSVVIGVETSVLIEALAAYCPDMHILKQQKNAKELLVPEKGEIVVADGNSDERKEIKRLNKLLEERERQLREMDINTKLAVESIQTFHKQQQALYDEFLILRQKYDDQKQQLIATLWNHCAQHHPELKHIPPMENENFIESAEQVGIYTIEDTLGEGQFATVHACRKRGNGEEFALKVINKDRITSFTSLRRVSNEIDILKRLDSKFIVGIKDVLHTKEKLYLVTERGGQDLFEFFDEHPEGVPEQWALEIVSGILEAVLYCHYNMICHRDLKPENILLSFDSDTGKCVDIKLCDFGLSTKFSANTLLTDFCGSPGFFAPEMIIAREYFGDKVDVWSVGCILLELVLGHERFNDVWMGAYDYDTLQLAPKFSKEIEMQVVNLPSVLTFSSELNDFLLQILRIPPVDRPLARQVCQHKWLGDRFKSVLESMQRESRNLSLKINDDNSSPQKSASPNDKNLLRAALSNRERRHIEDYNKSALKTARGEKEMKLPPIEPTTPSIGKARKIMIRGEEIVKKASGNYDFDEDHSNGHHQGNGYVATLSASPSADTSGETDEPDTPQFKTSKSLNE